ncbi:hypothetical protein HHI36_003291, partial [Cryptolaemus montrouzieri]
GSDYLEHPSEQIEYNESLGNQFGNSTNLFAEYQVTEENKVTPYLPVPECEMCRHELS